MELKHQPFLIDKWNKFEHLGLVDIIKYQADLVHDYEDKNVPKIYKIHNITYSSYIKNLLLFDKSNHHQGDCLAMAPFTTKYSPLISIPCDKNLTTSVTCAQRHMYPITPVSTTPDARCLT